MPADSSGLVAGGARQLASKIDGCRKQNSAYQFARVPVLESNGRCSAEQAVFLVLFFEIPPRRNGPVSACSKKEKELSLRNLP